MIRRFYIMPLNHGVEDAQAAELLEVFGATDAFIPGLLASAAGLDLHSRTAVWENVFVDEQTYAGPYMDHPYHGASLDSYLMADSPELLTHDIFTVRYELPGEIPGIDKGIRRLVLMNISDDADLAAMEALADAPADMATSVLCADNVGWVSPKGRAWTHIWEQGFADMEALKRYLATREGIHCASVEGLKRLGVKVDALKILTYPFELKPAPTPAPMPADDTPVFYSITARTAIADADAYVALLENHYDPYMADAGGKLIYRWRTVAEGYLEAEVQSAWELPSMAAYTGARIKTGSDARWTQYVRDAAPLIRGGTRRFWRAA